MTELEINPYDEPPADDAWVDPADAPTMMNALAEAPLRDEVDLRTAEVLIIGGGISGLSLAMWLARRGLDVHVLDKNTQPGGVIGTLKQGGFLFERGPNTVLDKYPSLEELVELAGLQRELVRVPLRTQARYVWLRG